MTTTQVTPTYMSHKEARRIRKEGVTYVLHLDIDNDTYVRAGEPGTQICLAVGPELSAFLYQRILKAIDAYEAFDMFQGYNDEAARAIDLFLGVGEQRQAFMAKLMDVLGYTPEIDGCLVDNDLT